MSALPKLTESLRNKEHYWVELTKRQRTQIPKLILLKKKLTNQTFPAVTMTSFLTNLDDLVLYHGGLEPVFLLVSIYLELPTTSTLITI